MLERTQPNALLDDYQAAVARVDSTEAEALVRQRRGQALFREGLLDYWRGRCAITGLDVPELLRARRAKPWQDATDAERLTPAHAPCLAWHRHRAGTGVAEISVTGLPLRIVVLRSVVNQPGRPATRAVIGLPACAARLTAGAAGCRAGPGCPAR